MKSRGRRPLRLLFLALAALFGLLGVGTGVLVTVGLATGLGTRDTAIAPVLGSLVYLALATTCGYAAWRLRPDA